jgi:hypothetical protein
MLHSGRIPKIIAAVAFLGLGCTGQVSSGPGGGDNGSNGSGSNGSGSNGSGSNGSGSNGSGSGTGTGTGTGMSGGPPAGSQPDIPGLGVFRRLSRAEYNNTIRDLLGDTSNPADKFAPDLEAGRSGFKVGGTVAHADAGQLLAAAETLGASAMGRLAELLPCKSVPTAQAEQDSCAKDFIAQFGKRAFRRPLTADESGKLTEFYTSARASTDFPNSMRLLISAILLSPQFVYRWEVTPKTVIKDGALVRHNSYEMASRLSYLLWASMPDDTAFQLADKNQLSTPDQIDAEARRLLKDPKAKQAIADFFVQWLGVTDLDQSPKDDKVYPGYKDLLASMVAETGAFAANAVLEGDGKMSTVFSSNKSFVDAKLAKFYGVAGVTGDALAAVDLPANERGGILTQAAFLFGHASANESSPPKRGKVLADKVVCIPIASPPDDVPDPKPPAPNLSVRDRFEEHGKQACAAACHQVIDPLGFAFENYNGIGGYQSMDGGKAVNASGSIKLDNQDKSYKNAIEFGKILGDSNQVAGCLARQFLRYGLRRSETLGDEASLAAAVGAFSSKGNNLRELIVGLTKSRSFTHRTPANGEVLQ